MNMQMQDEAPKPKPENIHAETQTTTFGLKPEEIAARAKATRRRPKRDDDHDDVHCTD